MADPANIMFFGTFFRSASIAPGFPVISGSEPFTMDGTTLNDAHGYSGAGENVTNESSDSTLVALGSYYVWET
jgi:hypothetical protein